MSQGRRSGDVGESLFLQASSPREAETLDAAVAGLAALDARQLRLQWRNHLGSAAPTYLPRWLLLRVLAYRRQAAALGDLDKASVRVIRASQGGAIDFVACPFNNRKPTTRDGIGLNSGALLVREWRGKLERVMVLDMGFAWNGKPFGSLPQVAKAITGVSWNGHRFFGLRSAKERARKEEKRVQTPMKTGGVGLLGLRTSLARKPATMDAKDPKVSDGTKLSGPSPTRNAPALASRGVASATRKRNLMSSSTASPAGTAWRSVHEAGGSQGELALRDLHPRLDREWIGAGVQLARQPTRSVRSLYQQSGS
jgi:Protein of unknown function (DUF2924)